MNRKPVRRESETGSDNTSNQYEETMEKLRNTMDQQNRIATREHEKSKHSVKLAAKKPMVGLASNPLGIVVRKEQSYVVIWSLHDGLMYAPEAGLALGTWIRYECISGESIENGKIKLLAYSTEDTVPLRITARLELTVQVAASIWLEKDGDESAEFIVVQDRVLGEILCSKDGYVLKRLERGEQLETFVIYAEDYRYVSHWIVVLVNRGVDDWRKMGNLPSHLDELAEVALKRYKRTDDADDYTSQRIPIQFQQSESRLASIHLCDENEEVQSCEDNNQGVKQFRPPHNWKGVIHLTDRKISEVPALVVEHEEGGLISVLYTAFGLARLQGSQPIGTWLMITMLEDQEEDEGEPQATVAENFKLSYYAQRHVKIPPPMSTRVIKTEGGEKILLCGIVTCGQRCLENPFLGVVDDSKRRVMPDDRVPPSSKGYLVEIGLLRRTKPKNPLFWRVLKFHGEAVRNINNVPLQESCVPNRDGDLLDQPFCDPPSSVKDLSVSSENGNEEEIPQVERERLQYVSSDAGSEDSRQNDVESPKLKSIDHRTSLPSHTQMQSVDSARQELLCYIADPEEKEVRGLGLVVRKVEEFVYVYSKTFGLSLLRACDFESDGNTFQFEVGQWINAGFVAAIRNDGEGRSRFKSICLPKIKPRQAILPTRIISNFVHVEVPFVFDDRKVSRCSEEPTKLKVESVLGYAIISELIYKKLELHGTERDLWTCYIKEKYGCSWKILTPNEISSDSEDDSSIVEESSAVNFEDDHHSSFEIRPAESPQLLLDFGDPISYHHSPLHSSIDDKLEFPLSVPTIGIPGVLSEIGEQNFEFLERQHSQHVGEQKKAFSIAELALEELKEQKEKRRS